jgi:hypothetical protein
MAWLPACLSLTVQRRGVAWQAKSQDSVAEVRLTCPSPRRFSLGVRLTLSENYAVIITQK